jgi:prepilin-type N-terminal cleavage/methylation domain-containing protein
MNEQSKTGRTRVRATGFTLIELLVVIAIIAILAAMIIPITAVVHKQKIKSVSRAQMAQLQTAIESYHSKHGHYPPDNPNNYALNQLYYELVGTVLTNDAGAQGYRTLDGSTFIRMTDIPAMFPGVVGFVNAKKGATGDESSGAQNFLKDGLKPGQVQQLSNGTKLLIGPAPWPNNLTPPFNPAGEVGVNPWRYNSSNPTNNPGSYDLWYDVVIGGKTNRICNWSKQPITVSN